MNAKESFNRYLKNVSSVLSIAAFVMGAAALTLSIKHPNSTVIATADIQAVMDAQKLVWVQRMKTGEGTQVLNDSREFQRKLEQVLARLAQDRNVVILDKNAFVAGVDVTDLTEVIMNKLDLSASETLRLRQRLENEFFSDFPTMRKDRP